MAKLLNRAKIPNVVIVGGSGCGKSTVAASLSKFLGFGYKDIDVDIETANGKAIAALVAEQGLERFRELEAKAIQDADGIMNHVISLGAGALENERNVYVTKRWGPMVWIRTPTSEIVKRIALSHGELSARPLLKDALELGDYGERCRFLTETLERLLSIRKEQYSKAAFSVLNSFSSVDVTALAIKIALQEGSITEPSG